MPATFQAVAAEHPSFPAFAGPDGRTLLDWAGYARQARQAAAGLAALGVRAGDVVALALADRHERYVVETALLGLGATSCPGGRAETLVLLDDRRLGLTFEDVLSAGDPSPPPSAGWRADADGVVPPARGGGRGRLCAYGPEAQRIAHRAQLAGGHTIVCVPDPRELAPALVATRPTHVVGAPQLYEGLQAAVLGMAATVPGGPLARALRDRAPDAAILLGLRKRLGLDRAEWLAVAGGPCPRQTLGFFAAIGLPLSEAGLRPPGGGSVPTR